MGLPLTKRRKVGTTSNHHAPYDLGYTRTTMAFNRGQPAREREQIPKKRPSSDCRLQPACMKSELLVIAGRNKVAVSEGAAGSPPFYGDLNR